ncbi:hypothetical protein D3C71_1261000 [compost metagenome]
MAICSRSAWEPPAASRVCSCLYTLLAPMDLSTRAANVSSGLTFCSAPLPSVPARSTPLPPIDSFLATASETAGCLSVFINAINDWADSCGMLVPAVMACISTRAISKPFMPEMP